jgi:hypothetical protein
MAVFFMNLQALALVERLGLVLQPLLWRPTSATTAAALAIAIAISFAPANERLTIPATGGAAAGFGLPGKPYLLFLLWREPKDFAVFSWRPHWLGFVFAFGRIAKRHSSGYLVKLAIRRFFYFIAKRNPIYWHVVQLLSCNGKQIRRVCFGC